jgi:hypothetical protein
MKDSETAYGLYVAGYIIGQSGVAIIAKALAVARLEGAKEMRDRAAQVCREIETRCFLCKSVSGINMSDKKTFVSPQEEQIFTCKQCGKDNTYISEHSYHNTVVVCRSCHHEYQIYRKPKPL